MPFDAYSDLVSTLDDDELVAQTKSIIVAQYLVSCMKVWALDKALVFKDDDGQLKVDEDRCEDVYPKWANMDDHDIKVDGEVVRVIGDCRESRDEWKRPNYLRYINVENGEIVQDTDAYELDACTIM